MMSDYHRRGAVGVKFGHAYWRTLLHDDISDADAAKVLVKILKKRPLSDVEIKALQDWAFRFVVRTAGEMKLVVQIHTGCQTNWGHIPDSNPLHLLNVIRDNPNVRFDLFHAGYPYAREIGMLGKHYPNVWLNMCWTYVITMAGSRRFLDEWIDLVPGHRLLGFGSDVGTPDFIYAHLLMARECIADVLTRKVERDFLSEEAAFSLCRRMLLENPCELYGIPLPR
jgi:predicted TIM-barrel fold metal-dependent hydrolase